MHLGHLTVHELEMAEARRKAGMVDQPPSGLAPPKEPQPPGGWRLGELEAAQARRRAKMVDGPGDVERQRAAVAARLEAQDRAQKLGRWTPAYPWGSH